MATVGRYWHTIRHLKPSQVYGRMLYRLSRPQPDLRTPPPVRPTPSNGVVAGIERPPSMVGPLEFRFLNDTRSLTRHGWDDPMVDKLWRYNLHYFDDLNARDSGRRLAWHRELLERWVLENPPAQGTGWEPYPTSLRIVNWIKWAIRGHSLPAPCRDSLAVQARWLSRRLETHLLGNHLFANAKALVFAGLYFDGPEAAAWRNRGLGILAEQVPEQILPDGGQFELSPMYHALALEDMLDLCNMAAAFPDIIATRWRLTVDDWRAVTGAMRHWLTAMRHPDGDIGFFNDAAFGIAPPPGELDLYADRLGLPAIQPVGHPVAHLRPSGYVRIERDAAVALLDVGRIGPDYLPAHAHADTLAFELSLFGQRLLVNSGTSLYAASPERLRQRGTAAHNTVVIDGVDSSEVWSAFRVARRAHPIGLEILDETATLVRCSHDGYRRLPGRPFHRRTWRFESGGLIVTDQVEGGFRTAQARFHLHPSVVVDRSASGAVGLVLPGGRRVSLSVKGGSSRVEDTTWHPGFGVRAPNRCIAVDFTGPELHTTLHWGET